MAHSSRSAPPLLVRTVRSTHRLEAGTEYRIGRDERADIPVTDPRVSWDHAVLYASGGTWVLEDKGSRNGTYAGAERVSRLNIDGPCVIHVGNPEDGPVLRFELESVAEAPSSAPPALARLARLSRIAAVQRLGRRRPARVAARRRPRAHLAHPAADGAGGEDRPPPGQRHRRARPRRLQGARRAEDVTDRPVPDLRPRQPQRHLRQRPAGEPGRADRGRHRLDRPRHLPAGRRRPGGVHRRGQRPLRGPGPPGHGGRRRQAEGAARGHHVPARRALHDGGHRPGRSGQVHPAQRADRQAPGDRRQRVLRLPRPVRELRRAQAPDRARPAGVRHARPAHRQDGPRLRGRAQVPARHHRGRPEPAGRRGAGRARDDPAREHQDPAAVRRAEEARQHRPRAADQAEPAVPGRADLAARPAPQARALRPDEEDDPDRPVGRGDHP